MQRERGPSMADKVKTTTVTKPPDEETGRKAIETAGKSDEGRVKGPNFTGATKEFVKGAVEAGHDEHTTAPPKEKPREGRDRLDADHSYDVSPADRE
jgi:hypothetical protein